MKKLLTFLLAFFLCASAYAGEVYYLPLASKYVSEKPRHLIGENETPFSSNWIFDKGKIVKRYGATEIIQFDGPILGYHQATDDYAIIAAGNGEAGADRAVELWEWNMITNSHELFTLGTQFLASGTTIVGQATSATAVLQGDAVLTSGTYSAGDAAGYFIPISKTGTFMAEAIDVVGGAQAVCTITADFEFGMLPLNTTGKHLSSNTKTYDATSRWRWTNHYDPVVGTVSIGTNGMDHLTKYIHPDQELDGIYTTAQERCIDYLIPCDTFGCQPDPYVKGLYPVSYYNSLYLANISVDYSNAVSDTTAVIWSEIDDSTDFSVIEYYQQRSEDGTPITGLHKLGDNLYLTKEDQVWEVKAYDNFRRVTREIGASNHEGTIAARGGLWVNDFGQVRNALDGTLLTQPIKSDFGSSAAGEWNVHGIENKYNDSLLFSAGSYLYRYDLETQSWALFDYGEPIELLHTQKPGKPWEQWLPNFEDYTVLSFAEIDTISDYILRKGPDGDKLVVQNHFNFDGWTTNKQPITAIYDTRTESCGDLTRHKRFLEILLQGDSTETDDERNPFKIYGWFTDTPLGSIVWDELGEITLDDLGKGQLSIDERGIWTAIRVKYTGTDNAELAKVGVRFNYMTGR